MNRLLGVSTKTITALAAAVGLSVFASTAFAQQASEPMSDSDIRALANEAVDKIEEVYVIRDKVPEFVGAIRANIESGKYDGMNRGAFVQAFGGDLEEVSNDRHMGFSYDPEQYEALKGSTTYSQEPTPEEVVLRTERGRRSNYGFKKIDRLPGNIGYIDLTGFWWNIEGVEDKAKAAMTLLKGSDAIIFDLRGNGGGAPQSVRLMHSHFFAEPTKVLSFFNGITKETTEDWTVMVPEKDFLGDVPLYVLTSRFTGSGAEDFAYVVKTFEKGTLVGEPTGGAAHTVDFFPIGEGYVVKISTGYPISPITNTNWERVGVEPDMPVPATDALSVAMIAALEGIRANQPEGANTHALDWALLGLKAEQDPPQLTDKHLKGLAGTYGPRKVTYNEGKLYYQRGEGPKAELKPLTELIFQHASAESFRLRFVREGNKTVAVEGLYDRGHTDRNDRTGN